MGISSLGVGSSVLTQDVIDQLKAVDESQFVKPITTKISAEKSKIGQLNIVNALMDNLTETTSSIADFGLFNTRVATVTGDAIDVSVEDGTDIQDFDITVNHLATKEIIQSGTFSSSTAAIADGDGQLKLSVGSEDFLFDYTKDTTLESLKEDINNKASGTVKASIVQIGDNDFRLFLTAVNTGTGQDISITDVAGKGEKLKEQLKADEDDTDGYTSVQTAKDASFKYNGLDITRKSNVVDDLLSGVTITLKEGTDAEPSSSSVSINQDVSGIESKLDSFVSKYNATVLELNKLTKSSQDAQERGIFSSDSTIKSMRTTLLNMISSVGEGAGRLGDYGFESKRDGTLTLDHSTFEEKLKENPSNVEAFFSGGTFTKSNGETKQLTGAFDEIKNTLDRYTKYNASLDQLKSSYDTRVSSLEEQKSIATKRLDAKYKIMAKRFASYDTIINQMNSASDMFKQLIDTQNAANK